MLALVLAFQKIQACLKNEEIKEDKTIHLMPVVYVINVRHDENNVFSILKPSTVVRPLTAPRSCIFQHPNSNFWSNIRAGFLQETWRKTRSTARPANKVPPKPSRMPYRSGRATSRGPFWY